MELKLHVALLIIFFQLANAVPSLDELSERRPIIKLNAEKFRQYVGSKSLPRNYSFVVMMTALSPMRSCQICRQAYEEFMIVATSYRYSQHYASQKLYFGVVDYDEGSEVFNLLGINSAPAFLYFNEKGKVRSPDELNIQRLGFGADVIGRWVSEKSGMNIRVVRPPNYSGPIFIMLFGIIIGGILYASRNSLTIIYNRNLWAFTAMAIVFTMTSGQMWNHIRGAPSMQKTSKGVSYIYSSSSGQYVIETYLVVIMNVAVTIGMILMTDSMRSVRSVVIDGRKRKMMAIIGLAMVAIFFSLLLSTFRKKSYGYPYSLLFK